ncbi:hypothetical protein Thermo_00735 [Thermoplasmatales archaeon]|nr:hypothetical protein Thermo_00735 [Thermoplasmatales archaeon]
MAAHRRKSLDELITTQRDVLPQDGQVASTFPVNMPDTENLSSAAEINSWPQIVHLNHLDFVFILVFRAPLCINLLHGFPIYKEHCCPVSVEWCRFSDPGQSINHRP